MQVLFEDSSVNRMQESLALFTEVAGNPVFEKTPMFVFLNKKDLFEEMIATKVRLVVLVVLAVLVALVVMVVIMMMTTTLTTMMMMKVMLILAQSKLRYMAEIPRQAIGRPTRQAKKRRMPLTGTLPCVAHSLLRPVHRAL